MNGVTWMMKHVSSGDVAKHDRTSEADILSLFDGFFVPCHPNCADADSVGVE